MPGLCSRGKCCKKMPLFSRISFLKADIRKETLFLSQTFLARAEFEPFCTDTYLHTFRTVAKGGCRVVPFEISWLRMFTTAKGAERSLAISDRVRLHAYEMEWAYSRRNSCTIPFRKLSRILRNKLRRYGFLNL